MTASPALQRKIAELTRHAGNRWRRSAKRDHAVLVDPAAKLGYLMETEVFSALSGEERTWLMDTTTMVTCEKGRVFYTPNEPSEVVFILKRGHVDLYRLAADGRKLVVATLGAHTIFGEMELIGQGMYGCYAEATEDCLLCVLSRTDLKALIHRNPDVGLRLLAELSRRLQQREAELEALAFRGVPARLAALLLQEMDDGGIVAGYSHQELAERLGTYRETVSQVLGRFRHEGLINVEPRHIHILDPVSLQTYAES